jgi:RNA polymerase sigma-B factor
MSDESDHDRRLFERSAGGDKSARDELVERHLPLAHRLAGRYRNSGEPMDDLRQVATLGLINAVDRYDPGAGSFVRFAVPTILGELKRYFRDSGWAVHVPRGMQERVMKLDQASQELHRKLGRSPSASELAGELGLTSEEVLEAMEAASAYDAISLEEQRGSESRDSQEPTYADSLGTEEERYELVEYGASIAPTMKALSERERLILHLRFVEDLTQSEIADRIGVSQMHVSRLIRRALARLRAVARERLD